MKKSLILLLVGFALITFDAHAQFNIALGKKATQSSNYNASQGAARLAVDGNTNGSWSNRSVTHTRDGGTVNPWWQVDLGKKQYIKEVLIYNRTDCCRNRLDNLVVSIYRDGRWERVNKTNHRYSPGIQYPLKFSVRKRAKWVKVQLMSQTGILSLAEVQVIGDAAKETKRVVKNTVRDVKATGVVVEKEVDKGLVVVENETKKGIKTVKNETKKGEQTVIREINKIAPIFAKAIPVGKPKKCTGSSFYDIGTGKCWTCPSGFKRTVASVKSQNACEKQGGIVYKPALKGGTGKGLLGTDCARGYFWDPNGKCYKCPDGYKRTVFAVTSGKACSQKVNSKFRSATRVKKPGCASGFYDVATNKCWECPKGFKRTLFPVTSGNACEKPQ